MNETRFEQELRAALRAESDRRINVDRAWSRFQRRRLASRRGRRLAAAAVAAVAVAAVVVPAAVAGLGGTRASRSGPPAARPVPTAAAGDAVVARIPVADVISLTSQGTDVWALAGTGELVRIDARTNAVTLRVAVAGVAGDTTVVAGGGALWLDGPGSSDHARLLRIDPATGTVSARTSLPPGCGQAAYGLGHVWILCNAAGTARVLRIDPATAKVDAHTPALAGSAFSLVAGSEGIWYTAPAGPAQLDPAGTRLTGLKVTGPKYLSIHSPDYIGPLGATQLVLGEGAVWALAGNVSGRPESVAAINPATGRITRAFTYPETAGTTYDFWGLNAAVGQGSIWVLAPLGHNEVVRVSMTTGRPQSLVYPGGSCSQYCTQIYDTAGAVWEPTSQQIIRIDPARMPA